MPDDYEIGYKRPPRATQFKKGQSGNPRGRQKATRNFKSYLAEELESTITIAAHGRTKTVTKQHAFIISLVTRAIKGDARAAALLITMVRTMFPDMEPDQGEAHLNATDQEILAGFLERRVGQPD